MMLEVWFGVALGLLLASNVALWLKLDKCQAVIQQIAQGNGLELPDMPNITEIKDEIIDSLEDFVSNMRVPEASDHILGLVANIGNMWAHQRFGGAIQAIQNQFTNDDIED
jgi:hypothetical protein